MEMQQECIRWDLHERHLQSMFTLHLMQDRFCDVTLACKDGRMIRAHRTILCACSGYFDSVLTSDTSSKDTLVVMKDCDYQDIQLIIQFMYYGEINVDENCLRSLQKTADGLQIIGLKDAFFAVREEAFAKVDDEIPGPTMPKSSLPIPVIHTKRAKRTVPLTNRNMDPLDGQMDLDEPKGEDFNDLILAPVDEDERQDEQEAAFDDGWSSKKIVLKNVSSRSRNQSEQVSKNAGRSTPGTSTQHHPIPKKSTSRRSTTGTSKEMLLKQLQHYLHRKFDGRIRQLNVDDLENYSIENEKGSCRIKCPDCDKLVKVYYGKYGTGVCNSNWIMSDVASHLNRHFK